MYEEIRLLRLELEQVKADRDEWQRKAHEHLRLQAKAVYPADEFDPPVPYAPHAYERDLSLHWAHHMGGHPCTHVLSHYPNGQPYNRCRRLEHDECHL